MRQRVEGRTSRASLPAFAALAVALGGERGACGKRPRHGEAILVAMAMCGRWANWAYWSNLQAADRVGENNNSGLSRYCYLKVYVMYAVDSSGALSSLRV
jgi:hypothetical protein